MICRRCRKNHERGDGDKCSFVFETLDGVVLGEGSPSETEDIRQNQYMRAVLKRIQLEFSTMAGDSSEGHKQRCVSTDCSMIGTKQHRWTARRCRLEGGGPRRP